MTSLGLMTMPWPVLKYAFALLYLLNYKNAIGSWHARFGWLCVKHTISHRLRRRVVHGRDVWQSRSELRVPVGYGY